MTIALNTHNKQLERKATTMTNAQNTVANQYLNSILRVGAKPLMIISILLTAMFILAACGGGAAAPAGVTPTTNPCVGNPFGSTCNSTADQARRTTVVQTCLAAGAANTPVCAQAIVAEPCIVDPTATGCATKQEFIAYLPEGETVADVVSDRADHCNENPNTANICTGVQTAQSACTATAPFANDLCDTVTNIGMLRTTYCTTAGTLWNDDCDAGEATYTGATALRNTACLESGVTADTSCASRANVREACNANPFMQTTTTNADLCTGSTADTGGTTYADARAACAVAATSFAENCNSQDTIGDVKLARDMACAESGTAASAVNDCATRPNIIEDCDEDDPFANTGCDTATHILAENNKIRTTYCTTATTSFDTDCTDVTDGMVNVARANLAMKCLTTPTDSECTGTFVDGESGTTIAACSGDPFLTANGCVTNDAFGAIRTNICTTGTTIFNTGCNGDNYGGTAALRASFVATCKANPGAPVCTSTFVNGVDGTTVAACNADAFIDMDGCNTHPAFNVERTRFCAIDANSFTAGCSGTTYAGADDARVSFAEDCANGIVTVGCDARIDGSTDTGQTIAQCNTNPFHADCVANGAFATAQPRVCTTEATLFNPGCTNANYDTSGGLRAALIAECAVATPPAKCTMIYVNGVSGTALNTCITDPFHTDCGDSIVDNTFASARAERIELCAATNDPFNTACEIDNFPSMNDAARDTYCQNTALPADGLTDGEGCFSRKAEICTDASETATYNPFASLCRDDSGIAGLRGTFCTAITDAGGPPNPNCETAEVTLCGANPFGTNLGTDATVDCTAGYATQRKTLADACRDGDTPANGATCTIAINNCNANPFGETAPTGGVACDPLAFADARTAYCIDPATTWNASCDAMAGDVTVGNDVTAVRSGVCAANGAITGATAGDVAAGESLFHAATCLTLTATADAMTITAAQTDYCAADANPWQGDCDNVAMANGGVNTVVTARNNVCLNNGAITTASETLAAGDSLFNDALCGTVPTIADVRERECETEAFAWHTGCETFVDWTIVADNDIAKARARACFD